MSASSFGSLFWKEKTKKKAGWGSVVSFFVGERECFVLDITNEHGRASGHGTGVKVSKGRAKTGVREEGADVQIYTNKHRGG